LRVTIRLPTGIPLLVDTIYLCPPSPQAEAEDPDSSPHDVDGDGDGDEESPPFHATTHASTKVGYMGPAEF
jgi:hypothetical protein